MAFNRPYDIRPSIVWLVRLQSVLSHRLGPLWLYHGAAKGARWGLGPEAARATAQGGSLAGYS